MEPTYIPRDVADYEEAFFFGLTARQLKWGSIAMVSGVSLYLFDYLLLRLPDDLCMYISVLVAFFLFWMGWRKWQRKRPYMEKVKAWLRMHTTSQKVIFKTDCFIREDSNVRKKTRKDRQINKRYCREYQRK
ncbi:MAG: PrgI family protein [Faecalicoccus sp.]|uniref:PrgI family protein n=1 Tax=Faecalicoccus sp. TaxID=1971758 RepID=UPI002A919DEA|nr:PrgI family protein [Faecalicoccus sp.]MDY5232068.1 PrgI family protein [Faecalicoccus sp.]